MSVKERKNMTARHCQQSKKEVLSMTSDYGINMVMWSLQSNVSSSMSCKIDFVGLKSLPTLKGKLPTKSFLNL